MEPSPSSDLHEWGGPLSNKHITIALITNCPTITVHTGKHYKALIDSEAAVSLVSDSTYQNIDNNLKTTIQLTSIHLITADGSPMTALGITTLQLQIADIKFSHNFIICDRLPNTEILLGINVQSKFTLSYTRDQDKNCYIQKEGRSLTYTRNCEQKANVVIVKSTLKIPPRHNGVVPMKIKGHTMKGHMAYFIIDQDSKKKGRTPTYTSLMEFITSKAEHMLMFSSQTTSINMPLSTKGNRQDTWNHLYKTCNRSQKVQDH